jgi:hypothetical protein
MFNEKIKKTDINFSNTNLAVLALSWKFLFKKFKKFEFEILVKYKSDFEILLNFTSRLNGAVVSGLQLLRWLRSLCDKFCQWQTCFSGIKWKREKAKKKKIESETKTFPFLIWGKSKSVDTKERPAM